MKYNPRRSYLHPVLRPWSSDYPDGSIETTVETEPDGDTITLKVNFRIIEPSIQSEIENGGAVCGFMLYCRNTLYRETFRGGRGSFELHEAVAVSELTGEVELHPGIFATDNKNYLALTAHPEYGTTPLEIDQWSPMAIDHAWYFQVNAASRPTKGIFNLEIEKDMPDGEFNIKCQVTEKYISITANENTRAQLKELGVEQENTLATVYMSALVEALVEIKRLSAEETVPDDGWVQCVKANIGRLAIDIGDEDNNGHHSLFRAAQMLLGNPFGGYMALALAKKHSEEDED